MRTLVVRLETGGAKNEGDEEEVRKSQAETGQVGEIVEINQSTSLRQAQAHRVFILRILQIEQGFSIFISFPILCRLLY